MMESRLFVSELFGKVSVRAMALNMVMPTSYDQTVSFKDILGVVRAMALGS